MRTRWSLVLLLGGLLSLQSEWVVGQTIYPGLHADDLADPNFCAYNNQSPWRRKMPPNPAHKRPTSEWTIARNYITNAGSGRPFWKLQGDLDYGHGCYYDCPADSLMSTFVVDTTKSNIVNVTFTCRCQETSYGCWLNDVNVCQGPNYDQSFTYSGKVPSNLVQGSNDGDVNWAVVQPNGDVVEAYHCQLLAPIPNGALFSSHANVEGVCHNSGDYIGAMLISNLNSDRGTNGAINSGPNGMAIGLKYWHTVPPTGAPTSVVPNQAIWMNTSCNNDSYQYPAASSTRPCQNPSLGLNTGAHLWLNMTHGAIDTVIAGNATLAPWRGVLYAAADYGIYIGDTGTGLGDEVPAFGAGWLENAVHVVANGGHNRWLDWARTIDSSIDNTTYSPTINFNPFLPSAILNNIEVVDECYALGTCSDSITTSTCPGTTSTAPILTITAPNGGNNVTVGTTPLTTLAGSATDDAGVTSVTWACSTCAPTGGTATCATCAANATSVSWSVGSIGLASGANTITVTANDASSQTGIDQIVVTYTPQATPELVAEYLFNGTPNDSSGKGNHLTLVANPSYVSTGATYGQGLQLNGSSQYATAANSTSLTLTTGVTMAAWLKPSATLTNSKTIVMKSFVYYLFGSIQANTICGATNLGPAVGIASPGGALSTVCTSIALPVGQWTHLAGRLLNGVLTLFVNGAAVGTPVNAAGTIDSSTDLLYVGGNPNPTEKFPGVLEKVQVYNYGLSNSEIAALATPVPETSGVRRPRHRGFVMK